MAGRSSEEEQTRACGVFGYPLGHSISAKFQQAAFDASGLRVRYSAWEVPPDEFPSRIEALRSPHFLGANVTIPHKEAALRLVDSADPVGRVVGAVNTVVNRRGRLEGSNTDVVGFLRALVAAGISDLAGHQALVLGAGGAARAVAVALLLAGVDRLVLANRHDDRAVALRGHLSTVTLDAWKAIRTIVEERVPGLSFTRVATQLAVADWRSPDFFAAAMRSLLIVNCTSAGMRGSQVWDSPLPSGVPLRKGALLFDVVANPLKTALMRQAEEAGLRTVGGLAMLVYQGAESFRSWTGREAPIDVMLAAAELTMAQQD